MLVFGSHGGLGNAVCFALKERGWTVESGYTVGLDKRRIDAVVNCIGSIHDRKPLEEIRYDQVKDTVNDNFFMAFDIMRDILPVMKKQKSGIIVNVASKAAVVPVPGLSVYSAMKAAVLVLTECAAKELKKDFPKDEVMCVTVSPSGMNTKMREKIYGKEDAEKQQSPKRVAEVIATMVDQGIVPPENGQLEQGDQVIVLKDRIIRASMDEWKNEL